MGKNAILAILDENFNVIKTFANFCGLQHGEKIVKNIYSLAHPNDRDHLLKTLTRIKENKKMQTITFRALNNHKYVRISRKFIPVIKQNNEMVILSVRSNADDKCIMCEVKKLLRDIYGEDLLKESANIKSFLFNMLYQGLIRESELKKIINNNNKFI